LTYEKSSLFFSNLQNSGPDSNFHLRHSPRHGISISTSINLQACDSRTGEELLEALEFKARNPPRFKDLLTLEGGSFFNLFKDHGQATRGTSHFCLFT